MYTPPPFKPDRAASLGFAEARGFGIACAWDGGKPIASALPFYLSYAADGTPRALFHVARHNPLVKLAHGSPCGGNMGTDGSVSFMFDHVGQFLFAPGTPEDKLMDAALEAGADDVVTNEDGSIEVICPPNDFQKVKDALEGAGFKAEMAEVTMKPQTEVEFTGDDAVKMQKLLDALENLDDVQEVYTNASIDEE